jgi:subtilisin family serine protease
MKTKLFFLASLLLVSVLTLSAQQVNDKQIPEKSKEIVDPSAKKVDNPKKVKTSVIPDQYVILFDENIVPPFAKSSGNAKFTNRNEKKKASDAYDKKMEGQIRKIAQEQLGITPAMIKSVFSAATTGIVIQLKNDQAKGLKAKLTQMKEVVAMIPDFTMQTAEDKTVAPRIPTFNSAIAQYNSWGVNFVGSMNYAGDKWAFILDTGIDLDHPDLNVGVEWGANFTNSPAGMDDRNGHGTHVAGIVAAKNNTLGTLGVAAGATVVPIKVLGDGGTGAFSWCIQGLNHVARYCIPGDVVNMSLGADAPELWRETFEWLFGVDDRVQMERCIRNLANAGVHMVIAAGNSTRHASLETPARTEGTRIYTISNADTYLNMAYDSNHGNGPVDYAAPGTDILSTFMDGQYAYMSGTSMAAPFVAGILLANNGVIRTRGNLYWDRDGSRDPIAVRQ